jgi:S-adenosylmethionine hydrolase
MLKNFRQFGIAVLLCMAAMAEQKYPPTIVFMTDFGAVDDSVAICRGVMYSIFPEVRIVDLTHQVTPFSILDGARFLYGAAPYYPAGAVFVVVIDPGVGSTRKAVVVKSKRGQYFVLPDNGLITLSSTFHGRDIFSPVGAYLARGEDWTQVGPEINKSELIRLKMEAPHADESGLTGEIIATDGPFGNLVTNIDGEEFLKLGFARGQSVAVEIGTEKMSIPFVKTFSDVAEGKPLLYIDSRGRVGLAVNQQSFAQIYGVKPPVKLVIRRAAK